MARLIIIALSSGSKKVAKYAFLLRHSSFRQIRALNVREVWLKQLNKIKQIGDYNSRIHISEVALFFIIGKDVSHSLLQIDEPTL